MKSSARPTLLLIVDVQQAFSVPPALIKRINAASQNYDLRVFTQFVNPPGSLFRRVLKQKSSAPGSKDLTLLVPPGPCDLVIAKTGYGLKPAEIRKIQRLKPGEITICGIDTDACVLGTFFSLFDAGIHCKIREDLCWSTNGLHTAALRIIRKQFLPPV